jgi:deoxyribodipyrimidine photolyase-related protein
LTTSLLILGDQLLDHHPGLEFQDVRHIVMVEASALLRARPYHRAKLALVMSAMRHYAERLKKLGRDIEYLQAEDLESGLMEHVSRFSVKRLLVMKPDSHSLKRRMGRWQQLLGVELHVLENVKMLHTRSVYKDQIYGKSVRTHEDFYRRMRRATGILMNSDGAPVGGSWNFDFSNRRPLPQSGINVPDPVRFDRDSITTSALDRVDEFEGAFGDASEFGLAVTSQQAQEALDDFIDNRLVNFGRYEDAMTSTSNMIFHSGLSPYFNLGLLDPLDASRRVQRAYDSGDVAIESAEGFIRQVIGWREYMHYKYSAMMPSLANANSWNHLRPLPSFWWTGETDMACMENVIKKVITTGYSHHIERLMILTSFAFMAEIVPSEVNEWFRSVYIDAYDWVVTPNVIGMGLNGDGGSIATKPYFSSANYINRMSDFCDDCRFDPRQRTGSSACPFNLLFWRKVSRERERLSTNLRSRMIVRQLDRIDRRELTEILSAADMWIDKL